MSIPGSSIIMIFALEEIGWVNLPNTFISNHSYKPVEVIVKRKKRVIWRVCACVCAWTVLPIHAYWTIASFALRSVACKNEANLYVSKFLWNYLVICFRDNRFLCHKFWIDSTVGLYIQQRNVRSRLFFNENSLLF